MPKLPRATGREMVRFLEHQGLRVIRIVGSHHFLDGGGKRTSVPVHGNRSLKTGTLRSVCSSTAECRRMRALFCCKLPSGSPKRRSPRSSPRPNCTAAARLKSIIPGCSVAQRTPSIVLKSSAGKLQAPSRSRITAIRRNPARKMWERCGMQVPCFVKTQWHAGRNVAKREGSSE